MLMCVESRLTEMGTKGWGQWECGYKYRNKKLNDWGKTVRHYKQKKKYAVSKTLIYFFLSMLQFWKIKLKLF